MTPFIPAEPGTQLYRPGVDEAVPVVGFTLSGSRCLPVIVGDQDFPEGTFVTHPDGTTVDVPESKSPVARAAPTTGAAPTTRLLGGVPVLDFSGKTFMRNSFWHHVAEPEFVFTLDPNTPAPKGDAVNKVTRDDYFFLRKSHPELTTDQLLAAVPLLEEDDEPDDFADDDDEDDLEGMV